MFVGMKPRAQTLQDRGPAEDGIRLSLLRVVLQVLPIQR